MPVAIERRLNPPASNPRQAACDVLVHIAKGGGYADRQIDDVLSSGALTGPDRGLFAELVFGVLRRQGTLDHILAQLLEKPLDQLDSTVLMILRIGVYQLEYLDRIPESAAVNESVHAARRCAPRLSGLVNAVLRNFLRRRSALSLPDPVLDPAGSIAARHSHPLWLANMWIGQLGAVEAAALAEASSLQPPLTLRVNTLQSTRDGLLQQLEEAGIAAAPCRYSPVGIAVAGHPAVSGLPGYDAGLFAVQDEASQLAGIFLGACPEERIWDVCAAPGGKTGHLAQQMGDRGLIVATDISPAKLKRIGETVGRLGLHSVRPLAADLRRLDTLPDGPFDRILLDAPCSGLGVIRRNPEAKWRLTPDDLRRLAATQRTFLAHAATRLVPGGVLLYSTCSTSQEENEEVVRDFLSRHEDFVVENLNGLFPELRELLTPEGFFRAWPHRHGSDGFFAARLMRLN